MVFFVKDAVLIFESVDKILWCDHTNETSSGVLLHSATHFNLAFYKVKSTTFSFGTVSGERVPVTK